MKGCVYIGLYGLFTNVYTQDCFELEGSYVAGELLVCYVHLWDLVTIAAI